ncbi:MAG: HAD-IA family hydrolase [Bacteroidota bacterium]|nr:MAG: HAD-IA family hydrolase [Bacteroidota bacterium]
MIQGILFDLDGTLVNSEPLWQEAEIEVFKEQGLNLTHADCQQTKGLPSVEAVKHWYDKISHPTKEIGLITQELNQRVISLLKEKGELKEGAMEILDFFNHKKLPLGIASASSMAHIRSVTDKFNLNKYFKLIYSGDFERYGKPHPGIFISACKKLKIDPIFSLAFEDSFNGLLAAKSARMKAVVLLDEGQIDDTRYNFANLKIESLKNFGEAEFELLQNHH